MPIAQMNWGRMRHLIDHPEMAEFSDSLQQIYDMADVAPGFIWRIDETVLAAELTTLGFDNRISATVSVWENEADLKKYTFETVHGEFIDQSKKWFERIKGTQLVIWDVDKNACPSLAAAFAF